MSEARGRNPDTTSPEDPRRDPRPVRLREMMPEGRDLRDLARLSLPVATVQVGMMAMGVVDTLMVGRVSAGALAAVALGHIYFFSVTIVGIGILMALDPIVSQAIGARDEPAVRRGMQRGLVLAAALSVVSGLALLPGEPLLGLLDQPDAVAPVAAAYARASIPGVLPFFAFVVLRQSLQAMGRVAPIVWVVVAANGANLLFNWMLVFGNLGAPELGAVGAGWASSLSRWLMALGILLAAWPLLRPYLRELDPAALHGRPLLHMVRIGGPIGIQFELEFGAFAVIAVFMGWLGTEVVAAHQIAINLASFTFMVPLGVAQATAVLVGQAVGSHRPAAARRAAGGGIVVGGLFMTSTAALFLLAPRGLAGLYSADPTVVAVAAGLIPIAGFFQVFDGLQVVAAGVLRGIGETRTPMLVSILGFWLVGLPVSLLFGFAWSGGPRGLWLGLAAGLAAVAVILLFRVRARFGGELRRISLDEGPSGVAGEISLAGAAVLGSAADSPGGAKEGGDG